MDLLDEKNKLAGIRMGGGKGGHIGGAGGAEGVKSSQNQILMEKNKGNQKFYGISRFNVAIYAKKI